MIIRKVSNFTDRDGMMSMFEKEVKRYDVLTPEEERTLILASKRGDNAAREKLINCNQRFIIQMARQYMHMADITDLIQEGNLGLITALDLFDAEKQNKFITFAVWYIQRAMVSFINNEGIIKKSNDTKFKYKVKTIKEKFFKENHRMPYPFEIVDIMKTTYGIEVNDEKDVYDISVDSISTTFDDDDKNAFENSSNFTEYTSTLNKAEENTDNEYNKEYIGVLMQCLNQKEKNVISMSFGLNGCESMTDDTIAFELGYSRERIRQIKNGAVEKMKAYAKEVSSYSEML